MGIGLFDTGCRALVPLLTTFINAANYTDKVLIAQTAIHITFLPSAMAIAATNRMMGGSTPRAH